MEHRKIYVRMHVCWFTGSLYRNRQRDSELVNLQCQGV